MIATNKVHLTRIHRHQHERWHFIQGLTLSPLPLIQIVAPRLEEHHRRTATQDERECEHSTNQM